jgi:hypothetical protein
MRVVEVPEAVLNPLFDVIVFDLVLDLGQQHLLVNLHLLDPFSFKLVANNLFRVV